MPTWTLGDRLRKARDLANLDQVELANRLGIGKRSVIRYERDQQDPKPATVMAWAYACGVPYEWLVSGETPGSIAVTQRYLRQEVLAA